MAVGFCWAEGFWGTNTWATGFWDGAEADFTVTGVKWEYYRSGLVDPGWVDISSFVSASEGATIDYGIRSRGPFATMADGGTMTLSLKNFPTVGQFTPGHANCLSGWAANALIRCTLVTATVAKSKVKFLGRIKVIDPDAGEYGLKRVHVLAEDFIALLNESSVTGLPLQRNKTEAELISAVFDVLPLAGVDDESVLYASDLDVGVDAYPIAFQDVKDGDAAGALISDAVRSSFGLFIQTGDGTVRFINRDNRTYRRSVATFTVDDIKALRTPSDRTEVIDRVVLEIPQPVEGDAVEVLASEEDVDADPIPADSSVEVWLSYRDPNDTASQPISIAGVDMISPVATTDYVYNSSPDGLGSNLTSDISIVADFTVSATEVKLTITNANLTTAAYRTLLRVRGTAVRMYPPRRVQSGDGTRLLRDRLPFQNSVHAAQRIADVIVGQYGTTLNRPKDVELVPQKSWRHMRQVLYREPGDRITLAEGVTATAADAIIHSVSLTIRPPYWVECRYGLGPQSDFLFIDPWRLGELGASEIGETTVLG